MHLHVCACHTLTINTSFRVMNALRDYATVHGILQLQTESSKVGRRGDHTHTTSPFLSLQVIYCTLMWRHLKERIIVLQPVLVVSTSTGVSLRLALIPPQGKLPITASTWWHCYNRYGILGMEYGVWKYDLMGMKVWKLHVPLPLVYGIEIWNYGVLLFLLFLHYCRSVLCLERTILLC